MALKLNLSSKLTLLLLLGLFLFLAYLRYGQWKNQVAIDREKKNLQDQIAAFSEKNQQLSQSLSYLGSSDFKERAARQQLNLKRNGEVVFGFTDSPPSVSTDASAQNNSVPNYEKWIEYFFGNN